MRGKANGNAAYASEMGVSTKAVRRAGGSEKLQALGAEIPRILLKPYRPRQSTRQPQVKPPMSQKALGMIPGVPGVKRYAVNLGN